MSLFRHLKKLKSRLPNRIGFELVLDSEADDQQRDRFGDPPEPSAPASLPNEANREARARALAELSARYRYEHRNGEPPHAADTPADDEVPATTRSYIEGAFRRGRLNEAAAKLALGLGPVLRSSRLLEARSCSPLAVYEALFKVLPRPRHTHLWSQDEHFAWRFVAGLNAGMLERVVRLPEWLAETLASIGTLDLGLTLDELVAARRLFAVDLTMLDDLPVAEGRYLLSAYALFVRVGATDKLSPVAIVLDPRGPRRRLFTPRDSFWNWQLAKAHLLSANNLHQQAISHYLEGHQIVEILALAARRRLHRDHPVARILAPHLDHSIGINTVARSILINDTGLIEESMSAGAEGFLALIRREWASWRWDEHSFEGSLARRGLDEVEVLANYPFRDDGRALLEILREHVTAVLAHSYLDDAQVAGDVELQALLAELGEPVGGDIRGLPTIESRPALAEFVSEIVFKATGLHHAMQATQYEEYAYIPGTAAALYAPLPDKELMSERDYLDALPRPEQALRQITTAWVLSRPTHESLLDFAIHRANHGPHPELHSQLCEALVGLSARLRGRQLGRLVPYESFDPQQVSARVEI